MSGRQGKHKVRVVETLQTPTRKGLVSLPQRALQRGGLSTDTPEWTHMKSPPPLCSGLQGQTQQDTFSRVLLTWSCSTWKTTNPWEG